VIERALDEAFRSPNHTSPTSTTTVPDSILERSRMSLMRFRRSFPEE
jgi:hypothetical protein